VVLPAVVVLSITILGRRSDPGAGPDHHGTGPVVLHRGDAVDSPAEKGSNRSLRAAVTWVSGAPVPSRGVDHKLASFDIRLKLKL